MADNYTTDAGTGGNTYASDDISSVHFSRIKLVHGADGTNDGDVSTANGLPVDIRALNGVDLMLGTDFSSVLGTASLVLGTQADDLANTSDGVQTTSMLYVYDGSTWDRLRGDATHGALVNLGSNNDVTVTSGAIAATNAGTFLVQENGAALTALQLLDNAIQADGAGTPGTTMVAGTKRQDSLSDIGPSVVDGDTTLVRVNARGAVWTELDSTNDAKITLDGEAVVLGAGTAEIGKLAAGTASIGTLGANSGIDIGDVDVLSQPALDRLTDNVGVALQTDVLLSDTTALTPKFAVIDVASSGDNTLVAAVTAKKIRVLAAVLVSAGTVTTRFEDGAGGTAMTGQMSLVANSGFTLPFNPLGWFETGSNTLLNLELSAAISVDGSLVYVEV